jgi:hypothetical protein
MQKKILGLKIGTNVIGWAVVSEYVSELPIYPFSETTYEIKEDKYIVDSTENEVVVFKIVNFESFSDREKFKTDLKSKFRNVYGADSKEKTGVCYLIFSDRIYSNNQHDLQVRAIKAMDWFIEILK